MYGRNQDRSSQTYTYRAAHVCAITEMTHSHVADCLAATPSSSSDDDDDHSHHDTDTHGAGSTAGAAAGNTVTDGDDNTTTGVGDSNAAGALTNDRPVTALLLPVTILILVSDWLML